VSWFALDEEIAVIAVVVVLVVLANVYVLRRLVGPVQALTALARQVDLTSPGQRIPDADPPSEAGESTLTFNEMLSRAETERREATGRVLAGQEAELHDQVQEVTVVLLGLSRLHSQAPPSCKPT
jgi:HAMP domain-containing protein